MSAMTFAATSAPRTEPSVPWEAAAAQECQGIPWAAVATVMLTAGAIQLTSATSVDPPPGGSGLSASGFTSVKRPFCSMPRDSWSSLANA